MGFYYLDLGTDLGGAAADSWTGRGGGEGSGSLKGFSRRAWSRRESKPFSVTAFYADAGG
jgi:hypothetical protein